jgi:hypothetical protein
MRPSQLSSLLAAISLIACDLIARDTSPLLALRGATRAEVTISESGHMSSSRTLRDSAELESLRILAASPGNWASAGIATPPSGDIRVAFYRNSIYLGVLSAGRTWIGARDSSGSEMFRDATAGERAALENLLAK